MVGKFLEGMPLAFPRLIFSMTQTSTTTRLTKVESPQTKMGNLLKSAASRLISKMMLTEQFSGQRGRGLVRILPPLNRAWRIFLFAPAVGILLFAPHCLRAGGPQLPAAQIRLHLEPAPDADSSARVGYVEISPTFKTSSQMGMFDDQGKPVACKLIWSPPNRAALLCFDTSKKSKAYDIGFGPDLPSAPGGWIPRAGVLLETRPCASAQSAKHSSKGSELTQVSELIGSAGAIQGIGYVDDMRRSVNPFGPSEDYLANFSGWFQVAKAGDYGFATDSSGPSILKVDGRLVTMWLGEHNAKSGRKATHNGTIHLQPGMHCLQYLNLQLEGKNGCEVAWKPPGRADYGLMKAGDFAPVSHFRVTRFISTTKPEQLYFNWRTEDACTIGNTAILLVRFSVVDNRQARQYRWRFDDGGAATGASVQHTFVQPGLRQVTLEAWEHGALAASNTVPIWIAAGDKSEKEKKQERSFAKVKEELLKQDLGKMPANELAKLAALADQANDPIFLRQVGKFMVQRAGEFTTPASGVQFYRLGLAFAHQGDVGDASAKTCFQLAIAPGRASSGVANAARLRLADLLINVYGQPDEAQNLIRQISGGGLSAAEVRLERCLVGDLSLARGQIEAARKQYLALTSTNATTKTELTHDSRLESINLMIEQNQLDQAWTALEGLQLEFPLERLSPGTGLIEAQLALHQNGFQRAFTVCQRLLPLAKDDLHLPELLYEVVESGVALGRREDANKALQRLVKEFPYSEAAAKANSKWSK